MTDDKTKKSLSFEEFEAYFKSTENADEYLCHNGTNHLTWSHCQASRIKQDLLKRFK